jgi:hypothetical protein
MLRDRIDVAIAAAGLALLSAGCAHELPPAEPTVNPLDARATIDQALPRGLAERAGWTTDIYAGFTTLTIAPTHQNICAVVAVIAQESGFRVDPVIPGLGAIAKQEIDTRAQRVHLPLMLVHGVLDLKSRTGSSYNARIGAARTEKELSDVFEDFIGSVPMGQTLFAEKNPIRTRGPMQVNVVFAEQFSAATPYPYPVARSIPDEVFTRRGSVYFGIAHLLDYRAPYDDYLYRFADFNAGQYSSRNAAFQNALSIASGISLVLDGALLPHAGDSGNPGATELAARALSAQINQGEGAIHAALEQGRTHAFEASTLYQRVFALAEKKVGHGLPHAQLPQIKLVGPKIKRDLSTGWYARRVDDRFKRCMSAQIG